MSTPEDDSGFTPEEKADAFEQLADLLEDYLNQEYSDKSTDPFPPISPDSPEEIAREVYEAVENVEEVCFGGKPLPVPTRTEWIELHRWSRQSEAGLSDGDRHDRRERIRHHGFILRQWALDEAKDHGAEHAERRLAGFASAERSRPESVSASPAPRQPKADDGSAPQHSVDFRSVCWFGTEYTFTALQAACVKVLWEAWEQGPSTLGEQTILEEAGSSGSRLDHMFDKNKHPAWGTMIVSAGKGRFRLQEPTKPEPPEKPQENPT